MRDLEVLGLELILADLETVERRSDKVRTAAKANPREYAAEVQALEDLQARLQAGERAADWAASGAAEAALAREMSLLTAKRRIYVANVGEDDLPGGGPLAEVVARVAEGEGTACVVLCAQLESDLSEWPSDEAAAYRAQVGLERSGLEALAWAGYAVLDLITFFTITGGQVVRAWAIQRGAKVPQAAGKVHSQMEKGFIRAEVLGFEQLVEVGDWHAAREQGILRIEGRDYKVQDGDVCLFRFSP
jgi:ribosome-binding ATPase YchF (GTP1/OBG family)